MDIKIAKYCSVLCLLTREDQNEKTKAKLAQLGCTDIKFYNSGGTQGILLKSPDHIIVAFRGTEITEKQDIINDGMFWPTRGQKQGLVHAGFARATDQVWNQVRADLDYLVEKYGMPSKVLFTGHSLGGAIAVVCAARSRYIADVYTFGQPRVGNKKFMKNVKSRVYRFTHKNDIVPRVPPGPLYYHQGREYHLFSNGEMIEVHGFFHGARLWFKAAIIQILKRNFWRSLIINHKMVGYYKTISKVS